MDGSLRWQIGSDCGFKTSAETLNQINIYRYADHEAASAILDALFRKIKLKILDYLAQNIFIIKGTKWPPGKLSLGAPEQISFIFNTNSY